MLNRFFIMPLCVLVLIFSLEKVRAQSAVELEMGANVIDTIMVDVETDLQVTFTDNHIGEYVVKPDLSRINQGIFSPATIRITGNPTEAMVDIQAQEILSQAEDGPPITISQFNVLGEDASSSISIMPFARDESFLLVIGGKVTGGGNDGIYKGVNILNINYL